MKRNSFSSLRRSTGLALAFCGVAFAVNASADANESATIQEPPRLNRILVAPPGSGGGLALETRSGERLLAQAATAIELEDGAFGAGGGSYISFGDRIPARSLIIRSSEMEDKTVAEMEEDLNVMARILDKQVEPKGSDGYVRKAMGINVFAAPASRPLKNLYLDGFGALFFLQVNYPLVRLAGKEEPEPEKKSKAAPNSAWEETKRELYGPKGGGDKKSASPKVEYDASRVDELIANLVEALKNAENIRHLKQNDYVQVVVSGSSTPGRRLSGPRKTSSNPPSPYGDLNVENFSLRLGAVQFGPGGVADEDGSTLTLRAKKQDIDAFARGDLDPKSFKAKVKINAY